MFVKAIEIIMGLIIGVICSCSVPSIAGDDISGAEESLRIPLMKKAPLMDGRLEKGEWDAATQMDGFLFINGKQLDPRCGKTLLGYDKDNLYLSVSSELPPDGKLVATVKKIRRQRHHEDLSQRIASAQAAGNEALVGELLAQKDLLRREERR